ncbi:ROK family protein [Labrys neptuniae]
MPLSRADLGRELGVTRSTVGNSIKPLLADGLLIELDEQEEEARLGRPGVLVAINPRAAFFIGLNISSTTINAVLLDFGMNVVAKQALDIADFYKDPPAVIQLLAKVPQALIAGAGIRKSRVKGVCIAIPGIVKNGVVISAPALEWQDVDLQTQLVAQMKDRWPIEVCNDAVALVSAVRADAADTDMQDVLLLLLAQGIGSARIRHGRIAEGAQGFAGEVGHMIMGPRASLRHSQTFEILAGYHRFRPFLPVGSSVSEGLIEIANRKDPEPALRQLIDEWAEVMAAGLLNLIHVLNPQSIVLGGPLAVLYPCVEARINEELRSYLVHGFDLPTISVARFGADGAAIGAAALLREALFEIPELADTP